MNHQPPRPLLAPVSKILDWSAVDGPGNRMVLFFQGCNFSCAACHNPHTMGTCNHCGDCVPACPCGALSLIDGRVRFDAALCDKCDKCLDACPIHANPMVQHFSIGDIMARLRDNAPFLSGLTVSGGEATMHLPFIRTLFHDMEASPGLNTLTRFIDSNGYLGPDSWRSVLDVIRRGDARYQGV